MNRAVALRQLPCASGACLCRLINIHNIAAPDSSRTLVKVAASMAVSFSAIRQSNELPAKAIMVSVVRMARRRRVKMFVQRASFSGSAADWPR